MRSSTLFVGHSPYYGAHVPCHSRAKPNVASSRSCAVASFGESSYIRSVQQTLVDHGSSVSKRTWGRCSCHWDRLRDLRLGGRAELECRHRSSARKSERGQSSRQC